MKRIIPYKTKRGALAALDNGGRFYNVFTKADDGEIVASELSKVAGVFSDSQKMFLFLEMALAHLEPVDTKAVIQSLSPALQGSYRKFKPSHFTPSQALEKGKAAKTAVITGIPSCLKPKTDFTGFIMVPVMAGSAMTFVMVPIMDQYDVYELRDQETKQNLLIAHARGKTKLEKTPTTFGGIFKKLGGYKKQQPKHKLFFEVTYHSLVRG